MFKWLLVRAYSFAMRLCILKLHVLTFGRIIREQREYNNLNGLIQYVLYKKFIDMIHDVISIKIYRKKMY